jgi:hypothetical protein
VRDSHGSACRWNGPEHAAAGVDHFEFDVEGAS